MQGGGRGEHGLCSHAVDVSQPHIVGHVVERTVFKQAQPGIFVLVGFAQIEPNHLQRFFRTDAGGHFLSLVEIQMSGQALDLELKDVKWGE